MDNIARRRRNSRRRGCRRNRKQSGGDGFGYTIGAPVGGPGQHIVNNFDGLTVRYPSCNEATRPGYITGAGAATQGGLPGFGGQRGGRGDFTTGATQSLIQGAMPLSGGRRRMRGGRYSFVPDVVNGVGMMEPRYSGCGEGLAAVQNPLNKDSGFPGSVLTAPPPQVPVPTPMGMKGGRRGGVLARTRSRRAGWNGNISANVEINESVNIKNNAPIMRRSRRNRRRQSGGVFGHEQQYAADAMVYEAPRSGYTHAPSNSAGGDAGTLADGKTPFLVNVPYSAQPAPSAACLKTGGGRKNRSRKNRKASRKNRKASRRNRK
jgi:hypothetical protein